MSIRVEGTVQKSDMGPGTWSLVTKEGETYEIHKGAPKDLLKSGLQVQVQGKVRDDVMSIAMIGPVLEVTDFKVVQ